MRQKANFFLINALKKNRKNGLSQPTLIDINDDGIVDRAYAGDFFGNLFAFDLTGSVREWTPAHGRDGDAEPLYSTNGTPITTKPAVIRSYQDTKESLMVVFGTGQKIVNDPGLDNLNHQLIGILDEGNTITNDTDFSINTIQSTPSGIVILRNKNIVKKHWKINLDGALKNYQLTTAPIIKFGETRFTLTKPKNMNSCDTSISSSYLVLDALTGGPTSSDIFLDEQNNPLRSQDGAPISGLIFDKGFNSFLTLGTEEGEQLLGTKVNGEIQQINRKPPYGTTGRRVWKYLSN